MVVYLQVGSMGKCSKLNDEFSKAAPVGISVIILPHVKVIMTYYVIDLSHRAENVSQLEHAHSG